LKHAEKSYEYLIHGDFVRSKTDAKGFAGAYWVSLLRMLKCIGCELVTTKLNVFEEEMPSERKAACTKLAALLEVQDSSDSDE